MEGVVAIVNLNEGRVQEFIDVGTVVLSEEDWDYDLDSLGSQLTQAKPLRMTQPEGASYQIEGNRISWQGWNFRYFIHPQDAKLTAMMPSNFPNCM